MNISSRLYRLVTWMMIASGFLCWGISRLQFGYLASLSAAHKNKFFKAKRIRDDLMFFASVEADPSKASHGILKKLKEMEVSWTAQQKKKLNERIKENLIKRNRSVEYSRVILARIMVIHSLTLLK